MRKFLAALAFGAALVHAADFEFPAVPVQGRMHAEFTLVSDGSPIGGLPVALAVPDGCGAVSPTQVTTDADGTGRFDFIAGTTPGACLIAGSSFGTTLFGRTVVYRPSDVALQGNVVQTHRRLVDGWFFALEVTAGGLQLGRVPIEVGPFPPGGPSAVVPTVQLVTDASGKANLSLRPATETGVYDIPVRVAGLERHVRARVYEEVRTDTPRSVTVSTVPWWQPMRATIVEGPQACALAGVSRQQFPPDILPPGVADNLGGMIRIDAKACGTFEMRVRLDYPEPVPADGQLWLYQYDGSKWYWKRLPAEISANSVTFPISEFRSSDGGLSAEAIVTLGRPGPYPQPAPYRVQDMWWSGPAENGWGMSILQSEYNTLFTAIYAYDAAGEPTWWVLPDGEWVTARGMQHRSAAYSPVGTPWYAFEGLITSAGPDVGRVQISFSDPDNAVMDFSLGGVPGRKVLQRQKFGSPAASPLSGVGGMWWGGPAQNGWGVAVLQQEATLFSVWFTYGADNRPTWFVMPGGNWSSADTYEGRIYRTRGSPWLGQTYDPGALQSFDVGSFKLRFAGFEATLEYALEGRTGTLKLQRQF